VLQEIIAESKLAIADQRSHDPLLAQGHDGIPSSRSLPSTVSPLPRSGSDKWGSDPAEAQEREGEMVREKDYASTVQDLEIDGMMPGDGGAPGYSRTSEQAGTSAGTDGESGAAGMARGEIGRQTQSAWERLRLQNRIKRPGAPVPTAPGGREAGVGTSDEPAREDERLKEQREFDEMLERERRGEGETRWS